MVFWRAKECFNPNGSQHKGFECDQACGRFVLTAVVVMSRVLAGWRQERRRAVPLRRSRLEQEQGVVHLD